MINIESDRFVETLFEEVSIKITQTFDFQGKDNSEAQQDLAALQESPIETVYSNQEMKEFQEGIIDECNKALA